MRNLNNHPKFHLDGELGHGMLFPHLDVRSRRARLPPAVWLWAFAASL